MMTGTSRDSSGVSVRSVERALDLLVAVERAGRSVGPTELAEATAIPKATAVRLLGVLERRGLVQKEQGRYQIGAGVVPLSRGFLTGNDLPRAALPVMEDLALATGETVSLNVRQGFERVCVQRVESSHPLRYTLRLGERLPLHVGAIGLVLTAAMPEEELRRFMDQLGEIRLATGETLAKEELLAKLEQIRRQGFAISSGERQAGVVSVSAPVVRQGRGPVAALTVTGPLSRMTTEKVEYLTHEVPRAAREISERYSHG